MRARAGPVDSDWDWGNVYSSFHYWKPADEGCAETTPRNLPGDAVQTRDAIPAEQVVRIYNSQDELLGAAFEYVFEEMDFRSRVGDSKSADRLRSMFEAIEMTIRYAYGN